MKQSVLRQSGWLSLQPTGFQDVLLSRGRLCQYATGEMIYSVGAPPGGIYAIVDGQVAVTIAPGPTGPHLAHLATPGSWFGEGSFLTGEPRRIGLQAVVEARLFHVPLDVMGQLAAADPMTMRRFAQIAVLNIDLALRAVDDLLIPDPARRIAATLLRCLGDRATGTVTISQTELGRLSNASRKVVNRVLGSLADKGWLDQGYGEIEIRDADELRNFSADR